jgi:UDP-N-acetylmuramyl tripeptide synthase
LKEIQSGFKHSKPVVCEPDRQSAIAYALGTARAEDVVLVAGKGHEAYQLIKDIKYPFDDAIEVKRFLSE